MRCIKCGAENKKMIGPFCIDCYPLNIKVKPAHIKLCVKCGAIFIHGKWIKNEKEKNKEISNLMKRKVSGEHIKNVEYIQKTNALNITLEDYGITWNIQLPAKLEIQKTTCPICSRILGGYYEGIVQLRGAEHKIAKAFRRLTRCLEKNTFITKVEENKNGIDIYTGSSNITTQCIMKLHEEMKFIQKVTRSLSGLKEGKRIYRTTYSLRFN